jgi:hypothetical protein
MWYLSQYLLGASSAVGKQVAGLQGLWNGHGFPPWYGGYRTDLHLQMNQWSALTTNRIDLIEPYVRLFALELRDQMRSDTARHWGWGGIKIPLCFGPRGQEISTWLPAKLWPGGTAWVALDFLRFWEYSSDAVYLTTIAFNFALECAEFLENWLFQTGVDRLEIFPSFCPNLGKGTPEAWAENPTADIALFRSLFRKMLQISTQPGIHVDPRRQERWQLILERLPDYPIQNGKWCDARNVDWKEPHRYLSKMLPVYPLDEVSQASGKSDFQTALQTLKELEETGLDKSVGFTQIWYAALEARLGNTNRSIEILEDYLVHFSRENGLNRHFSNNSQLPADIFQIDANLAFADVLNQLFLQWTDGVIRLFPGMGKNSKAQFWGWRTPGGHLVAAVMEKGKIEGFVIEATRPGPVSILSPFTQKRLTFVIRNKSKADNKVVINKKGKLLEFDLKAGQRIEFGKMTVIPNRKIKNSTDSSDDEYSESSLGEGIDEVDEGEN